MDWRLKLTWLLGSGIPLLGITLLDVKVDGAEVRAAVIALAAAGLVAGLVATQVAARAGTRWSGLGSVALRGQQAPTAIYEPAELVTASA